MMTTPTGIRWSRTAKPDASVADFLPNFCQQSIVGTVIVIAAALALVGALLMPTITDNVWTNLFLILLLIEWIALTSVAILCWLRPYLLKLKPRLALLLIFLMLLVITALIGELALRLLVLTHFLDTINSSWYGLFHGQNLIISAVINALVLKYILTRHQLEQSVRNEMQQRATISSYRVRPHFLYSNLNAVAGLVHESPQQAESIIEDLGELIRLMLDEESISNSVEYELTLAKKYTRLEQLRLGDRLKIKWNIADDVTRINTPSLLLVLLLEIAIHQGIENLDQGGKITVSISQHDDQLNIEIGYPVDPTAHINIAPEATTALENIHQRLVDIYSDLATFTQITDNQYCTLTTSHATTQTTTHHQPRHTKERS